MMNSGPVPPIPKRTVLAIHDDQIKRNGGMAGVRDENLLESALAQPFASFEGQDFYPTTPEKAARYGFEIVKNHPFIDGNKRTGAALVIAFLRANGRRFKPSSDDFYRAMLAVADGSWDFPEFADWVASQADFPPQPATSSKNPT